jgi:hypothetical protein
MNVGDPSQNGAGTDPFEHPSRDPSHENGLSTPDPTLWDVGTDGTDEVQGSARARFERGEA